MNYFGMNYQEIIDSPMQRLLLLSKSIPKAEKSQPKEKKKKNILDFAKENNLLKK